MRKNNKCKAALLCLIMIMTGMLAACSETNTKIITSTGDLLSEITKADAGAVIIVGDIDFTPQPGVGNEFARISLQKEVTIRSGYKDRNAVFTDACFNVSGSKVPGETLACSFQNITFDGGVSKDDLSAEDWELPLKEDGTPRLDEPEKAQYAVEFSGNVSAAFDGCVFKNYMYETGPVIRAYYGDYTGNPELVSVLGDYSNCRLSVSLTGCEIKDNAAMLGGSIYLDGNNNITFRAERCVFSDNFSGCGEFSEGGGVCRLSDLDAAFYDCSFTGNEGNHCYLKNLAELTAKYKAQYAEYDESDRTDYYYLADTDRTRGGAVYSQNGSLYLSGCSFFNNRASLGGALNLLNTNTQIRDCNFTGNHAVPAALNPYDETGPWSAMGMGGAVYAESAPASPVVISSTEIVGNIAEYAYGSIYGFWSDNYKDLRPLGLGSIDLYNCTVRKNLCRTDYDYSDTVYPWASHPGDILEIEYLSMHGCVFTDDVFEKDFPRTELPSAENDYNYIACSGTGSADYNDASEIRIPGNVRSEWNKSLKTPEWDTGSKRTESRIPFAVIIPAVLVIIALVCLAVKKAGVHKETGEAAGVSGLSVAAADLISESEIAALRENVVLRQLLTEREMDVMCEYISGSSRSSLARKLMISESTAKTHISNIYSKLDVNNKKELIKKLKTM